MGEKLKPFVVAEGGSGVGKTTAVNEIQKELAGWRFFREPGGTKFAEAMREAVQGHLDWQEIDPTASLFAYSAARADLVNSEVIPILEDLKPGKGVFLDRYWFSTIAYQGSEKVDREIIVAVSKIATKGLMPDLVLHFDLLPEIAVARKAGCTDVDRYDLKKLEFHRRVRDAYLELSVKYPDFWRVIDASQSKEQVLTDSLSILREFGMI